MNDRIDDKVGPASGAGAGGEVQNPGIERKRLDARRRFMRLGAGGSAAVVVTVMHKRAFAGSKKTPSTQSLCGSNTTPDLKGANGKNALQASAMGTPKGLVCYPQTTGSCNAYNNAWSDNNHLNGSGGKVLYVKDSEFNTGCGSVNNTLSFANNNRLYNKGFCPIKINPNGSLSYDTTASFYKYVNGNLTAQACTPGVY